MPESSAGKKLLDAAAAAGAAKAEAEAEAAPPPAAEATPPTGQAATEPGSEGGQGSEGQGQAVPYDRFKSVNDEAKALREKVAAFEAEQEKARQAQLSEAERLREEKEAAEKAAADAVARAEKLERDGWLRAAAARASFADPEDAVALVAADEATDQASAEEAVKKLAEAKPHLIGQAGATRPMGTLPGGAASGPGTPPPPASDDPKEQTGRDLLGIITGKR